jgi:hypothetical protein
MYTLWEVREIASPDLVKEINGKWVPARPVNYKCRSWWTRVKEAWAVYKGKADCFTWPEGQ